MKKKVLLFGPPSGNFEGAYGGGTGGYTRKMSLYLNHFHSEEFEFVPCYHTVAGQGSNPSLVLRFIKDVFRFLKSVVQIKPDLIHILAQYRTATPREFIIVKLSRFFKIPVVYEIKAGVFHSWYPRTKPIFRSMVRYCIRQSGAVLCQGMPYVDLIKKEMHVDAMYFPNFVPQEEIPETIPGKLEGEDLKVLFVGFAFRDKGVFELVNGCNATVWKVPIELTLIGKEHPEFTTWLDNLTLNKGFRVNRLGKQPHELVLGHYAQNDIYCYPSRHSGEGHNNSINEAMMYGMIIVTTRQGFMESVLGDTGYFIDSVTAEAIAMALAGIADHREEAKQKSIQTRKWLLENFTADIAFEKLHRAYRKCLKITSA